MLLFNKLRFFLNCLKTMVSVSVLSSGLLFAQADELTDFLQQQGKLVQFAPIAPADPLAEVIQSLPPSNAAVQMKTLSDNTTDASQLFNPIVSASSALVVDAQTGEVLYRKNSETQLPIASITKLMTAMVVLDAAPDMNQRITIDDADVDRLKNSSSRLTVGTVLSRDTLLHLGLMSSENRAMHALARSYAGGMTAFVQAMNAKARALGMNSTVFYDPTGLNPYNQSTASDLVRLVQAASAYPLIRAYSTSLGGAVTVAGRTQQFRNSNRLVRDGDWDIALQKTGYIRESGRSMVVRANVMNRPLILVLLDAPTSNQRINDARAVRTWFIDRSLRWTDRQI